MMSLMKMNEYVATQERYARKMIISHQDYMMNMG